MSGRIESGPLCTDIPIDPATLTVGDTVLCKVHGNEYPHLVSASQGSRYQVSNNRGYTNGWIGAQPWQILRSRIARAEVRNRRT